MEGLCTFSWAILRVATEFIPKVSLCCLSRLLARPASTLRFWTGWDPVDTFRGTGGDWLGSAAV